MTMKKSGKSSKSEKVEILAKKDKDKIYCNVCKKDVTTSQIKSCNRNDCPL